MRVRVPPSAPLVLTGLLLLCGCDRRPDNTVVDVSVIADAPAAPGTPALSPVERVRRDATAQGLVRFDASGQVEPGLAERWIVIEGGTSYIFRLRTARWTDGAPVTARQVVAGLRRALRAESSQALRPHLTAISTIVEMTPQVIEVRLARPRPDLLKLFAQPEFAVARARGRIGTGPMEVVAASRDGALLRPLPLLSDEEDPAGAPRPEEAVHLRGERASLAVARFAARRSDLVTGGSFVDWPIAAAAQIAPANLRTDPAAGLFGLRIVSRAGFLADAANRVALSQAIDRPALLAGYAPGWEAVDRVLPDGTDSARAPVVAPWTLLSLAERRRDASAVVRRWKEGPVVLRVAMPGGAGATPLFARLAASLQTIGVSLVRVAPGQAAELRLIDMVAPHDSARWYLHTACAPCGADAAAALEAARLAPTLADRGARLAEADAAVAADASFIPLARPLRWSLVALRLSQWQPNARAWHPLNRLRSTTN